MMSEFKGKIGRTLAESQPFWPTPAKPNAGAPNVVLLLLDDVGFADIGCYGSEIKTPNIDRLAGNGVRFSNFHVTPMCSPTRASLLTGRNAHSVGVGAIAEWSNGFPGYRGTISPDAATIAQILADRGYGTYAIGKWHLSNLANYSCAGPHDDWPLGKGFSRWYGFLGGYVDHWHPDLHIDNQPVRANQRKGYHLTEDLIDQAIGQVRDHVASAHGRPFLSYLALGAGHWPHHVPSQFIDAYKGVYTKGWDAVRRGRFERQKELGLVPRDTLLPESNPGVPLWDTLSKDQKRVNERFQETYAGFLTHTDEHIGRFIRYLESIGEMDNTIFVVMSDNGASGEGGTSGAVNIRKHLILEKETLTEATRLIDTIGSEYSFSHYPAGWAQVSNTPLKWYKKNTHGGGVRAPLIVHWPKSISDKGVIAKQFHHAIDIVPTLLDAIGVNAPDVYRGVAQQPIHGESMLYILRNWRVPTRKAVQHFEMVGDRAIWVDGWKAVARHVKGKCFDEDEWELYHLETDFSEMRDLSLHERKRLGQMIETWWNEAENYGVLPLDDREGERAQDWFRNAAPLKQRFLPGMARFDRLMIPDITDRNFSIRARFHKSSHVPGGVVLSVGNRFGGFVLYCSGGNAIFEYALSQHQVFTTQTPLRGDITEISVAFEKSLSVGGRITLGVNGTDQSSLTVPLCLKLYGLTAGLTCGYANVPISQGFELPFDASDSLVEVVFELSESGGSKPHDAFEAILQEQ